MFTAGLAWYMLSNTQQAHWRLFSVYTALPSFLCWILTYFYVPESARFLASIKEVKKAHQIVNEIENINGEELMPLIKQRNGHQFKDQNKGKNRLNNHGFRSLFSMGKWKTTGSLMIIWLALSFGKHYLKNAHNSKCLKYALNSILWNSNLHYFNIYYNWTGRSFRKCILLCRCQSSWKYHECLSRRYHWTKVVAFIFFITGCM